MIAGSPSVNVLEHEESIGKAFAVDQDGIKQLRDCTVARVAATSPTGFASQIPIQQNLLRPCANVARVAPHMECSSKHLKTPEGRHHFKWRGKDGLDADAWNTACTTDSRGSSREKKAGQPAPLFGKERIVNGASWCCGPKRQAHHPRLA